MLRAMLCASIGIAISASLLADNPVVVENQKPGTTAWQIGLPPYQNSNDTDQWIRGYASAVSVNKGETITLNITVNPYNWKTGTVPYYIDIYRIGWYGGSGGRLMQHLGPFTGVQQPGGKATGGVTSPGCPYDAATGMIACRWTGDGKGSGSYNLDTSQPTLSGVADWTSGIYVALLSTAQMQFGPSIDPDHQTYIIFTIRDDASASAVLFQQAVNTYQAYNNYPNDSKTGKSLYDSGSFGPLTTLGTQRAVKVSFDRPYTYSDHTGAGEFLKWELYYVRWLERTGYDVSYTTDVDVHANGASLLSHKVLVSAGHSEYWSAEMRNAAEAARDQGTSLGFFGGNAIYNQVRFEPSPVTGTPNRVMVAYKDAALDPANNPSSPNYNPALTTIPWRSSPVNRPEQQTLGAMYVDYFSETSPAVPYVVKNSSHWMYLNSGLTEGTSVPGVVGYEMDAQFPVPSPASQPGTYVVLSNSPFVGANMSGVANSVIYRAAAGPGAWVFDASSIYWSLGLDSYVPPSGINTGSVAAPSAGIQQVTANFLNAATGNVPTPAPPTALTATSVASGSISLAWTNNATNATAVLVDRSTDNLTFTQITSLAATAATYTDTGLNAGTLYYYRVRAQNASGSSAYSNTANATTLGIPAPPTSLTAVVASTTSISLTWANNATNATAVLVENSTDNVTFTQIASLAATATTYTNTGLTTGTVYYYRVRAQNAAGFSAYSNTASATPIAPPTAPTSLTAAIASTTSISLTWTNSATNATSVLVERSTDNVTFTQIASLAAAAATYTNSGLTTGTLYYYRVRAQNGGGFSAYSNTASATPLGVPTAPTSLIATAASTTSISITWTNSATNATSVLVERSTDNVTFTQIASLPATAAAYTDTGLITGTFYYYRVRTQNAAGFSAYSNTASAAPLVPAAPASLAATVASATSITLAWTNTATNATSVLVERSIDNVTFKQIASLAATAATYTDTGLTTGTLYYYRVRAQNAAGFSAYSNTATATPLALPTAPTSLTAAAASTTSINLTWTNRATNATAVLLERSTNNVTFTQITSLAATAAAYTDTGLTTGTLYYYRVRAQNAAGFSAYSNTASATPAGIPPAPTALTASALSATSLALSWTNNATNATAVLVERSTNGTTFTQIASLTATAATYTNTGLTTGTLYYYRVRAQNASGFSAYSNTATATPLAVPTAPTSLTAAVASTTSIALTWTNRATNANAVLVERSIDNIAFSQIASLAASAITYTDASPVSGTRYYYRVRAQNTAGFSGYSNVVTINAGPPAAPSTVAAGDSSVSPSTQINVYWKDNSNNETGFLVYRSRDGVAFTQIGTAPANAVQYDDPGLPPGTIFYYYVTAVNAAGASAPSNTDSTITHP